jgi:hypothetical protein
MSNKYFGNPCKRGHDGERYARNGECVQCARNKAKQWAKDNPEQHNKKGRETKARYREKTKEYNRLYRLRTKEQRAEYKLKYYEENKYKYNTWVAQRRALKLNATPSWLTKEHKKSVRIKYKFSDTISVITGIRHHVDHIIPLQGENVCGLHVPWNLQVIPATENTVKHNHVVN